METMICPGCQKEIAASSKFCPECGQRLLGEENTTLSSCEEHIESDALIPEEHIESNMPIPAENTTDSPDAIHSTDKKSKRPYVILAIAVLAIGIFAYFNRIDYSKYTDYIEGDDTIYSEGNYSDHRCEYSSCSRTAVCVLRFKTTDNEWYYCDKHVSFAKSLYNTFEDKDSRPSGGSSSSSSDRSSSGMSAKDSYGNDVYAAFTVVKKMVKDKLKSPSTAKFCDITEATFSCSGKSWTVTGWVDAQNGFGATIRSTFTVKFTATSRDNFNLNSCIIT